MRFYRLLVILLFTFFSPKVFAATFVVTSNADSGPGTLRQALLDAAANGTATVDNINFNLTGTGLGGITITVQTQLPDVTANVIIDGTTQPGAFLGNSNAKVIITPATPAQNFNGFNVSSLVGVNDQVEFYGLYIEGFAPNQQPLGNGIVTNANCKLVIGAPGKGNVISGNNFALVGYFQNAIIQSNFIGVLPDGVNPSNNASVLYSIQDYNNLLIGGPLQQDGNVILCGSTSGINFGGGVSAGNKTVNIANNYFSTDYTGMISIAVAYNACILVNDPATTLNVTANVFSATEAAIAAFNQPTLVVKGNFFGTDKTQTFPLGNGAQAINEVNGVNATIGGTTAADQNVFTNYQNPILATGNCVTNVIQNMFYCNSTVQLNDPSGKNFIRITGLTNNSVSGAAPAGATVQLYYTATKCGTCNPNTWFATVTANAAGLWQYSGNTVQNVLASSTVNNNTVGFQFDSLSTTEVNIVNYDCHHAGSITFKENRLGRMQVLWLDNKGTIVGNGNAATNLQPGTYSVQVSEGGTCPSVSGGSFTIIDLTPHVYASTFQLDCNNVFGYFTAFPGTGPGITVSKYYWQDSTGTVISTTSKVTNLGAGTYSLYITDSNGCNSAKAFFTVKPAIATPAIDDSKAVLTDATCGLANGSVTGLTLTNAANANYGWDRANGTQFSFGQLDLKNAPPGQYYLSIAYNFNCPPIKSKLFTIVNKGTITVDTSAVVVTSSTCNNSNGSVKGIVITGATQYQWFDASNNVEGTTLDLLHVPQGSYYLVASNAYCSIQTRVYVVGNIAAVNNFPSTFFSTDASCNQSNGSLTVTFDSANAPVSYRWANATGTTLASNKALLNQPAATYTLYVTDSNGCESIYKNYTIDPVPPLQIMPGSALIITDQCLHSLGGITGVAVTGGIKPYRYTWLNSSNQIVSEVADLKNVPAGVYTLQVKDSLFCDLITQNYTIANQSESVVLPDVKDQQVCSPGAAVLVVQNPQTGFGYRLYENSIGGSAIGDNQTGIFNVSITGSRSYYISQYSGSCESDRAEVKVTVGVSDIIIPNTFTPNGDGINDYWNIGGLQNYPYAFVQIFNRYGQKVFESKGYSKPFDGKFGGSYLPGGVYYFIINLNSRCSLLSGSLTIIR
jgi:gliding motility-associated-like protein